MPLYCPVGVLYGLEAGGGHEDPSILPAIAQLASTARQCCGPCRAATSATLRTGISGLIRWREENADVLSFNLLQGIAEKPLEGPVDGMDPALAIDQHDSIG
ncbi:MAG: hypothetical protein Kow0032_19050 [Methyloligellaceae bacterium]